MRIVVIGAGAVGGYFGGRLLQSGDDVTFIARNRQLAHLQQQGLNIKSIDGDIKLPQVKVMAMLPKGVKADIIFVAVKTFQLSGTFDVIKAMLHSHTRVIPLLNGISAAGQLITAGIPPGNICGGLAKIIAKVNDKGTICHTGAKPHITLGLFDGAHEQEPSLIEALAIRLKTAGISVGISRDIELALWRKYLFVAAWGTLASVARVPVGTLRENPQSRALLVQLMNEYRMIANSQNVAITQQVIDETMVFIDKLPSNSETSMQRDIVNGCPSEVEALVSDAYILAQANKLQTPCLHYCHTILTVQREK